MSVPATPTIVPPARGAVTEVIHGVEVEDRYRLLEQGSDPEVVSWQDAERARFQAASQSLPQRAWLEEELLRLWRYDDESVPAPCVEGGGEVFWTRAASQDKWVVHLRQSDGSERVVLDPNTWPELDTLAGFYPSPDCTLAAYGRARGGDENPVIRVIELDTLTERPDRLRGWRQGGVSWKRDASGFYYSARPTGPDLTEVVNDQDYFHRVWYHPLGTTGESDSVVVWNDEVKERFHWAYVSEDGRWLVGGESLFNTNDAWIQDLSAGPEAPRHPIAPTDAEHQVAVVDDTLVITTDWGAPNRRVYVANAAKPGREHWKELIPESPSTLEDVSPVGGYLYARYLDKAASRIEVYTLDGVHHGTLALPTVGTASVSGTWSRPETWVQFSSYASPASTWRYEPSTGDLTLHKASPVPFDGEGYLVEQLTYPSKDGTPVTMFVVRQEAMPLDGSTPVLLTGYGGFNVSQTPGFSATYALWVAAGGAVAVPNLRGGGEYGRSWHEAGMLGNKQNVFDDFIAAAEALVDRGYTSPSRLAIAGGSNGGLLVSAAVTQRPELFRAVYCGVPLADMLRFHLLGIGGIWTEEYGTPADAAAFQWLRAYSPYHAVVPGTDYPAILVTGSQNDARTDPAHARKFFAAVRTADADAGESEPIFMNIQADSGHHGGVSLDTRADQLARTYGFLMQQVGLAAPAPP